MKMSSSFYSVKPAVRLDRVYRRTERFCTVDRNVVRFAMGLEERSSHHLAAFGHDPVEEHWVRAGGTLGDQAIAWRVT